MTDEALLTVCLYIAAGVLVYVIGELIIYLDSNYFTPKRLYRRSGIRLLIERIEKERSNSR